MCLLTSSNHCVMNALGSFSRSLPLFPPRAPPHIFLWATPLSALILSSIVFRGIHPTLRSRVEHDWLKPISVYIHQPLWLVEGWAPDPVHTNETWGEDSETDRCSALHETCWKSFWALPLGHCDVKIWEQEATWVNLRMKLTKQQRESSRSKARALMTAWTPGPNHSWIRISQGNLVQQSYYLIQFNSTILLSTPTPVYFFLGLA